MDKIKKYSWIFSFIASMYWFFRFFLGEDVVVFPLFLFFLCDDLVVRRDEEDACGVNGVDDARAVRVRRLEEDACGVNGVDTGLRFFLLVGMYI